MLVTRGQESVTNDLVIRKQCFSACTATPFGYDWRTLDEGRVMSKCNCSMSISVLGDGCQFCQPQTHIDLMRENYNALLAERDELLAALEELLEHAESGWDYTPICAVKARIAIKKARG